MTTEDTKYCTDCVACMTSDEMRKNNYHREWSDPYAYHWCSLSRPNKVDKGPTTTCTDMRNYSPSDAWGGCGDKAVLFVPKPQVA